MNFVSITRNQREENKVQRFSIPVRQQSLIGSQGIGELQTVGRASLESNNVQSSIEELQVVRLHVQIKTVRSCPLCILVHTRWQ